MAREEYEEKKSLIVRELGGLNFGTNQTLGSLMKNRARRRQLEKELDMLQRDYEDQIDPQGAIDRSAERKIEEIDDRVKKLEKKTRKKPVIYNRTGRTITGTDGTRCYELAGNWTCY